MQVAMGAIVQRLLANRLVMAIATREVRHLATAVAGALMSWLIAHQASQSDAASIAQGVSAVIVGAAGYGMSLLNGANNDAQVQIAAETGQVPSPAQARTILSTQIVSKR